MDGFQVDVEAIEYVGQDLQRPECILAERDGTLWSADARGGVMRIGPDGEQELIAQVESASFAGAASEVDRFTSGTLPNGLAFDRNGDLLVSNFGTDRLERMKRTGESTVMVDQLDGQPIGKVNFVLRDSKDRIADYAAAITALAPFASYLTVNVSSPNTPGLRQLQAGAVLDDLLARAVDARDRAQLRKPLLLKIAPDLSLQELDELVVIAKRRGIDGMIVSNTTVSRTRELHDPNAAKEGGLSGRPLFALSTWMLGEAYKRVDGTFPLVGVGGIDSADAAWRKVRAGASLLQLYTALTYKGFGLVGAIKHGLVGRLSKGGHRSLAEVVGADVKRELRD